MLVQFLFVPGYFFTASTFCTVPLCLSLVRSSLIIHEVLLSVKVDLSWSWGRQTLKMHQFFWTPLLFRTTTHGFLLSRFLKSLKNLQLWPYLFFSPSFRFLNTLWTPQPVPEVYILANSSLFVWGPMEHILSSASLSLVSRRYLQRSPKWIGFPMQCCGHFATYIGKLQVS